MPSRNYCSVKCPSGPARQKRGTRFPVGPCRYRLSNSFFYAGRYHSSTLTPGGQGPAGGVRTMARPAPSPQPRRPRAHRARHPRAAPLPTPASRCLSAAGTQPGALLPSHEFSYWVVPLRSRPATKPSLVHYRPAPRRIGRTDCPSARSGGQQRAGAGEGAAAARREAVPERERGWSARAGTGARRSCAVPLYGRQKGPCCHISGWVH